MFLFRTERKLSVKQSIIVVVVVVAVVVVVVVKLRNKIRKMFAREE